MNITKTNTNNISNTVIGNSQIYSDRTKKEEIIELSNDSKNPFEFTFGDLNYFQKHIGFETKKHLNT